MIKDYFKLKTWIILSFILFTGFSFSAIIVAVEIWRGLNLSDVNVAEAKKFELGPPVTGDRVSGFAWSSNIGWISFNSADCDIDGDGNYEGAGEAGGPAPTDCPASGAVNDYGVTIDVATGNFSGYVWSTNVGWIYFGPDANLPVYGPTNAADAPSNPKIWAHYDNVSNNVTGWAKILSLGNDGWIKFKKNTSDGGSDYGVTIDPASSAMSGWAWNGDGSGGSLGIGWISFNSNDCDNNGTIYLGTPAGCPANGTSYKSYKVSGIVNRPPEIAAGSMTAPNWSAADACLIGGEARGARLKWRFTDLDAGSFGSAYQIKVIRVSDSMEMLNTGKCTDFQDPDVKCKIDISCMNGGLTCTFPLDSVILPDYNTKYKWSVIVWDNGNMPSSETWYNSPTDTDNNDSDINSFTTYKHEFPDPYFVWSPSSPSIGEDALFKSQELAKYYTGNFSTKTGCDESNCNWAWTLGTEMTGNIVNPSGSTTIINLTKMAVSDKEVYLTVTDNDGYACGTSTDMNINKKLPVWKETK